MEFYCDFMEFYGDIMGFNGYFVESNEIWCSKTLLVDDY
jgi:hypothetical protein